ncbi:hypothetical protein HY633_01025 [Candidatus Uhrbacteria bacterium]|nr:hypothetical protein [Candidatus Uhrbacteria bacterium]
MFELHVDVQEIQNPSVPIRWCVDKATLDAIKASGAKTALVHVYCADGHTVPLSDGGTYVSFRQPGLEHVSAEIVTDKGDRIAKAEINFMIPAECFPKPVQERWDYPWLTMMIDPAPHDECALRRRRLFAYTVQPVVVGAVLTIRYVVSLVIVTVMLLMGMRGIDWRANLRPGPSDSLIENDGSIFLPRWKTPLRYLCLAFMPLLLLIVVGIGMLVGLDGADSFGFALACLFTVFSGVTLVNLIMDATGTAAKKLEEAKYALPDEAALNYLLCGDGGPATPARRPIKLRYRALKAKVCRPFKA